jgi:hypothetical protein
MSLTAEQRTQAQGLNIDPDVLEKILDILGPLVKRLILAILTRTQPVMAADCDHTGCCVADAVRGAAACMDGDHDKCFHHLLEALHSCHHAQCG